MANVLGTLFKDIAEAIRSKTGETDTMKPLAFPENIAKIPTPNPLDYETLLPLQKVELSNMLTSDLYYEWQPAPFVPVVGGTYDVTWDDEKTYRCVAFERTTTGGLRTITIGNAYIYFDDENTGEPFLFTYFLDNGAYGDGSMTLRQKTYASNLIRVTVEVSVVRAFTDGTALNEVDSLLDDINGEVV